MATTPQNHEATSRVGRMRYGGGRVGWCGESSCVMSARDDAFWGWVPRERPEAGHVDGIRDDKDPRGGQRGAQDGVLFAGVGHADDGLDVAEGPLEDLVCADAGGVGKAKQGVVCKHNRHAERARMQGGLVAQH